MICWKRATVCVAVGAVVLTAGCGGGGGGTRVPAIPLDSHLRMYAPGDQWTYSLHGIEQIVSQYNYVLDGTETRVVSQTTLNGQTVLAFTTTDDFTVSGQPIHDQYTVYETQDPVTGAMTYIADDLSANSTLRTATPPKVVTGGTFQAPRSGKTDLAFDNGDTQSSTGTTQTTTVVTVPAGTFSVWSVTGHKIQSNGRISDSAEAWAPQLGVAVQSHIVGTGPAGFSINFLLTLTSTNVPLGGPPV